MQQIQKCIDLIEEKTYKNISWYNAQTMLISQLSIIMVNSTSHESSYDRSSLASGGFHQLFFYLSSIDSRQINRSRTHSKSP